MKAIFKGWNLWRVATWGLFAVVLVCVEAVRAQDVGTETVLHSFSGTFNDGSEPTGLVQLPDGSLYGVTVGYVYQNSSVNADNVYFKITTSGTYTPLANGCGTATGCTTGAQIGRDASSSLINGGDGNLYAIASINSYDQFYQLTPQGAFTALYRFSSYYTNNADFPGGSQLIPGSDGNFYGTAYGGPSNGAIFRVTPGGVFTQLYAFTKLGSGNPQVNSDGAYLNAPLVEGTDGNFYGVALYGGVNGSGTIFKITPGGVFNVLYTFSADGDEDLSTSHNADGAAPGAGLVRGNDGNFYGTTQFGGANGVGTIFKITPAGVFTKLHDFGNTPQASITISATPSTITAGQSATLDWAFAGTNDFYEGGTPVSKLTLGTDGNLYGVAGSPLAGPSGGEAGGGQYGNGIAFQITPGGTFTILYSFGSNAQDGTFPYASLVQGSDGNFYGTTYAGGADPALSGDFGGTVFKLAVGPAPASAPPCTASGAWSGSEPASGSFIAAPTTPGNYTYTLTCTSNTNQIIAQDVTLTVTAAAALPVVTIAANPTSVVLGNSATLTWSSTNATSCTASGSWSGSEAVSGTQGVTPGATGTSSYALTCTGSGGSVTSTATVTVTAPPLPTVTITANPASLVLGNSTTLSWSSTNATNCTASGAWSGAEATSGTQNVTPATTGTNSYVLTCTGSGGSTTGTASVTVTAAVPTVMIAINPTAITTGQGATLSWSSSNATACTASGAWSGSEATSGTLSESPSAAGTDVYTLSCTGSGGTTSASATLTVSAVTPPPPAAPTVTIAANPPDITLGQSTTLSWSSTNATACTASGAWNGAEPTAGSMNESPDAAGSDTYTLSCSGAGGSASASASVTVTAPTPAAPTLSITAQPAAITLGQSTTLSWSSANAGSCTASGAWSGDEDTAGEQAETPAATGAAIYTLSCSGPGGNVVAAVTVTVSAPVTTTELTGKAGGGGFGFGSLFGLGLFALLRRRTIRRRLGYLLMLFCVPAFAQDPDFDIGKTYLGVRGGVATYIIDRSAVNSSLAASGDAATVSSIDHRKGAGVLYAGVPFYHGLSLELGYADLGIYHVSLSTSSANVGQVATDTVGQLKPAGRGITLGLGGPFDLGRWFAVEPHLGALIYQSKQEVFTPGGTYSRGDYGVGLDAGVALLVHPFRPVYAGAGFECFDTGGGCNVRLASLQLEYHFGH